MVQDTTQYFTDAQIEESLNESKKKAEKLLKDEEKLEAFLEKLEAKLRKVPIFGEEFSDIPVYISLINAFVKKKYTNIPIGSILAILGALIYFVSPIDLIPDIVPFAGYLDDIIVMNTAEAFVKKNIKKYKKWREEKINSCD